MTSRVAVSAQGPYQPGGYHSSLVAVCLLSPRELLVDDSNGFAYLAFC